MCPKTRQRGGCRSEGKRCTGLRSWSCVAERSTIYPRRGGAACGRRSHRQQVATLSDCRTAPREQHSTNMDLCISNQRRGDVATPGGHSGKGPAEPAARKHSCPQIAPARKHIKLPLSNSHRCLGSTSTARSQQGPPLLDLHQDPAESGGNGQQGPPPLDSAGAGEQRPRPARGGRVTAPQFAANS